LAEVKHKTTRNMQAASELVDVAGMLVGLGMKVAVAAQEGLRDVEQLLHD